MPSKSGKQHRFMEMVAHSPAAAKRVGVPQSVGKEFASADKSKSFKKKPKVIPVKQPIMASPPPAPMLGAPVAGRVAGPMGDNRAGRLKPVNTDRGAFRFKDNRKGE